MRNECKIKVYTAKQDTIILTIRYNHNYAVYVSLSLQPHSVHELINTHNYMLLLLPPHDHE